MKLLRLPICEGREESEDETIKEIVKDKLEKKIISEMLLCSVAISTSDFDFHSLVLSSLKHHNAEIECVMTRII